MYIYMYIYMCPPPVTPAWPSHAVRAADLLLRWWELCWRTSEKSRVFSPMKPDMCFPKIRKFRGCFMNTAPHPYGSKPCVDTAQLHESATYIHVDISCA